MTRRDPRVDGRGRVDVRTAFARSLAVTDEGNKRSCVANRRAPGQRKDLWGVKN